MTDPDIIDTLKKARDLSLKKWERVRTLAEELFDEIDKSCGFCHYGMGRVKQCMIESRCDLCTVEPRCKTINSKISEIQNDLGTVIGSTLTFLYKMDVDEVESDA